MGDFERVLCVILRQKNKKQKNMGFWFGFESRPKPTKHKKTKPQTQTHLKGTYPIQGIQFRSNSNLTLKYNVCFSIYR